MTESDPTKKKFLGCTSGPQLFVQILGLHELQQITYGGRMNWEKAANIATVAEAIVVAVSIIFIWKQLRQQTKLTRMLILKPSLIYPRRSIWN